jgi:hypothetical protein
MYVSIVQQPNTPALKLLCVTCCLLLFPLQAHRQLSTQQPAMHLKWLRGRTAAVAALNCWRGLPDRLLCSLLALYWTHVLASSASATCTVCNRLRHAMSLQLNCNAYLRHMLLLLTPCMCGVRVQTGFNRYGSTSAANSADSIIGQYKP